MGTIADMGISSAHQGEAQGRTEFETMLLEMLGQNKLAGTTQETDLMNKLSDIMGLRQSDLISMYNELAQAEWERQFKQAQLDQEASIAQAQIDAAAAEGAANRAASAKDDSLAWAEFNEGIRRWNAENQQGLDAAGLTQSNWERDFGLRSKEAPIDRSADAELFWDDDRFMDPKTKQNDIGAYLRFKATGELPNWNTNKGGGGVSGVIHSNGLREFLGGAAQMGLSPAHTMYGWLK
jgi:hypothetical protein